MASPNFLATSDTLADRNRFLPLKSQSRSPTNLMKLVLPQPSSSLQMMSIVFGSSSGNWTSCANQSIGYSQRRSPSRSSPGLMPNRRPMWTISSSGNVSSGTCGTRWTAMPTYRLMGCPSSRLGGGSRDGWKTDVGHVGSSGSSAKIDMNGSTFLVLPTRYFILVFQRG